MGHARYKLIPRHPRFYHHILGILVTSIISIRGEALESTYHGESNARTSPLIKSESGDLSIVRDVLGVSQVPRISFSNSISKTRHDDVLYRTSASYLNVDDISKVNFRLPSKSITEDVGSPSSTDVKGSVTSSPLFNPTPVVFTDEQNQSLSNKWTPPPSNVTFAITSTQVLGTMQDESPSHSKPTFEIDSMSDRHHDAIGAPSYFDTVIQASLESNILPTQPKTPLAFLSPTSTLPEVTNTPEIATVFPYYDTAKLLIDARLNTLSTLAPGKSHNGVLLDKIDISPTPTFSARSVDEGRLPSDVNIINDPQVYDSNSNALDVAVGTSRSSSTIINQTGHQDVKSGALSQGADVMVSTGTSVSLHSVLLFEEGREISTSFTISSTTPGDVLRPSSDSQVAKDESALPAGTVAGIVIASVGFVVILSIGAGLYVFKRFHGLGHKTYDNKFTHDNCSYLDSLQVSYINSHTELPKESSDEMFSLDNDSFLNSLEAMTMENYWADSRNSTRV